MLKATIKDYKAELKANDTNVGEMLLLIDFLICNIEKQGNVKFSKVIKMIKDVRKCTDKSNDELIDNSNK